MAATENFGGAKTQTNFIKMNKIRHTESDSNGTKITIIDYEDKSYKLKIETYLTPHYVIRIDFDNESGRKLLDEYKDAKDMEIIEELLSLSSLFVNSIIAGVSLYVGDEIDFDANKSKVKYTIVKRKLTGSDGYYSNTMMVFYLAIDFKIDN